MEAESESVDISSLKIAILQPSRSLVEQESTPHLPSKTVETISTTFTRLWARRSQRQNHQPQLPSQNPTQPQETLPELDSTVPDSADIFQPDVSQAAPQHYEDRTTRKTRAMTNPASPAEATQELSQSIYRSILKRHHDEPKGASEEKEVEDDDTLHTLHEGDEGHINFSSGFDLMDDMAGNGRDSDDEMLLHTQTQNRLPNYPDSQRFKTPATAGKKRRRDGSVVDSPEISRRPMLRQNATTPGNAMGLSQAFAATQAVSSPLIGEPGIFLPSDRPSPNIELQNLPVTATTSSPLLPPSEFQRAATEPASHYISVTQSQDKRNCCPSQDGYTNGENGINDDFDVESSIVRRHNTERERRLRSRRQLELASSPTLRRKTIEVEARSSPVRDRPDWSRRVSPNTSAKPPLVIDGEMISPDLPDSEAETEEERTSPINPDVPTYDIRSSEDDKENIEEKHVQVPQTALRLQRVINEIHDVQASPLLRHTTGPAAPTSTATPYNPQQFAVANSQSSRTRKEQFNKLPSSSGGLDFVPQSQNLPTWANITSPIRNDEGVEDAAAPRSTPLSQIAEMVDSASPVRTSVIAALKTGSSPGDSLLPTTSKPYRKRNTNSTIQETKPDSRISGGGTTKSGESVGKSSSDVISRSGTGFESARTRVQLSIEGASVFELSSPPIVTTPPGLKRQRMAEIAAEPSSLKSSLGFDALGILQVNEDFQNSATSPFSSPAILHEIGPEERVEQPPLAPMTDKSSSQSTEHGNHGYNTNPNSPSSSPNSTPTALSTKYGSIGQDSTPLPPLSTSRQARSRHGAPTTVVRKSATRASLWELQASPPQRAFPTPRLARKTGLSSSKAAISGIQMVKQHHTSTHVAKHDQISVCPDLDSPSAICTESDITKQDVGRNLDDIIAPDMVFACYNGKARAYYPARCLGHTDADKERYKIQWDGYDPDEIDEYGIRRLDLRIGDAVKVDLKGLPRVTYLVRGLKDKVQPEVKSQTITDIRGHQTVTVAAKQRRSLPTHVSTEVLQDVPIASIYLDSNMWNQMKDRLYEYVPAVGNDGYATPLERSSTPGTPCSRSRRPVSSTLAGSVAQTIPRGLFSDMIFAISYEDTIRKNVLVDLIRSHGGLLVQGSFTDLLEIDRVALKAAYQETGFTALLASRHSRKEKYMQALALNIPCLSGKWIEACIAEDAVLDWKTYLLPAGESTELEGATRSRVMTNAIATEMRLSTMLETRPLMLKEASVVVIVGKGKAEIKRKPYLFLIQALGASRIEKVVDLKAAKSLLESDPGFTWCFVEDKDVDTAKAALNKRGRGQKLAKPVYKVAGNETIVQSLILGRLCES